MDTRGVVVVKTSLEPLCGELHSYFALGLSSAAKTREREGLTDAVYNSVGADIVRAKVHKQIDERGGIGSWKLVGKHHLRGQLMLRSGLMRLRFLHESSGFIPSAGRNPARKAYYRNVPFGQLNMLDAESSGLLGIWSVPDADAGQIRLRVVRTLGDRPWSSAVEPEVDLDFILPDTGSDLASLEFEQYDDGLDLPFFDSGEERDEDEGDENPFTGNVG